MLLRNFVSLLCENGVTLPAKDLLFGLYFVMKNRVKRLKVGAHVCIDNCEFGYSNRLYNWVFEIVDQPNFIVSAYLPLSIFVSSHAV